MQKAIITFSNGDTLEIQEGQMLVPIVKSEKNGQMYSSKTEPHEIQIHVYYALIDSILDLVHNCSFFSLFDKQDKVYNVSSIVSIEDI